MTSRSRFSIIIQLLWGKTRRFLMCIFTPGAVKRSILKRHGECDRCGTCCLLPFRCSFLKENSNGELGCSIYSMRPPNCRVFPIDMRDINERDLIAKGTKCGYSFPEK